MSPSTRHTPDVTCGLVVHHRVTIVEGPVRVQCQVLFSSSEMPADHGLYISVSWSYSDIVILAHSATEANGRLSFICVQWLHCLGKIRCDYLKSHVVVSILIIKKRSVITFVFFILPWKLMETIQRVINYFAILHPKMCVLPRQIIYSFAYSKLLTKGPPGRENLKGQILNLCCKI